MDDRGLFYKKEGEMEGLASRGEEEGPRHLLETIDAIVL
jgi:hypothetical protein